MAYKEFSQRLTTLDTLLYHYIEGEINIIFESPIHIICVIQCHKK